jgi:hypothetical protein
LNGSLDGNPAEIVDLSTKGARVQMVHPLEPGKSYYLIVSSDITVEVTALWSELDSLRMDMVHDTYLSGLAFSRPSRVVGELLDELVGRGTAIRIEDYRSYDRYRLTAPITGSFGATAPVSLLDVSLRGARIAAPKSIGVGSGDTLRFQVDGENGPIDVHARVAWAKPGQNGEYEAGLSIIGQDERMRAAIQSLCIRGEARIDLDSLRRKFDGLRAVASQRAMAS